MDSDEKHVQEIAAAYYDDKDQLRATPKRASGPRRAPTSAY